MEKQKYIRSKINGQIYLYSENLAKNPSCEIITEEEAFPERFMPIHTRKYIKKLRKKKST